MDDTIGVNRTRGNVHEQFNRTAMKKASNPLCGRKIAIGIVGAAGLGLLITGIVLAAMKGSSPLSSSFIGGGVSILFIMGLVKGVMYLRERRNHNPYEVVHGRYKTTVAEEDSGFRSPIVQSMVDNRKKAVDSSSTTSGRRTARDLSPTKVTKDTPKQSISLKLVSSAVNQEGQLALAQKLRHNWEVIKLKNPHVDTWNLKDLANELVHDNNKLSRAGKAMALVAGLKKIGKENHIEITDLISTNQIDDLFNQLPH